MNDKRKMKDKKLEDRVRATIESLKKLQYINSTKELFTYLIPKVPDKKAIKAVENYVSKDKDLRKEWSFYKTQEFSQYFWPELLYVYRRNLENIYELIEELYLSTKTSKK
ncbi:MAG: hypothetical protein QXK80_01130 [Candidatus Pacearchaeota archaeon]